MPFYCSCSRELWCWHGNGMRISSHHKKSNYQLCKLPALLKIFFNCQNILDPWNSWRKNWKQTFLIEQDNLIVFLTSLNIISCHIFVAKAFTILYGRFSWRICDQENFLKIFNQFKRWCEYNWLLHLFFSKDHILYWMS